MNKMRKALCILMSLCLIFSTGIIAIAEDGPSEGEYSFAYIMVKTVTSEELVWGSENALAYFPSKEYKEISYDLKTNTLTLNSASYPYYSIIANEMGDDFKIKLVGNNELLSLTVWGYGWGGSLKITGNGSLTLNSKKMDACPIIMMAEGTAAKLVVDASATLTMNLNQADDAFVLISETSVEKNAIELNGNVKSKTEIDSYELQYLKTVPAYTGTLGETVQPYTKSGSDELYHIKQVTYHPDDDNFDVTEDHIFIYDLIPCDRVECGYIMVFKEDLLEKDIPSEYTPNYDMSITAVNTSSSLTGGSNCEVVVELATGTEYIVMEKWTGSGFENYLAEIVCEIEHDNAPAYFVVEAENSPRWARSDDLPDGYDYVTEGGSGYYNYGLFADGETLVIEGKNETAADLNGDGKLSVVDAKWTLQAVASARDLTPEQKAVADVNKDGKVTVVDAKWILQAIAGTRVL